MSRKIREEAGERLRRGKSQDGGNVSVHARNTANFLSPEASHGLTSLERVPSLNRLHAQSSTETSGLGETVTSGFSSQESVHSYVGDDKERDGGGAGLWSRKRGDGGGGSSLSGVRQARDYQYVDTDTGRSPYFELPIQQTGPKYVTFSTALRGQGPIEKITTSKDVYSKTLQVYEHLDGSQSNPKRHYKDTGGRSLTPKQAKDEQDTQRRTNLHNVTDRRKPGSTSNSLESQTLGRPDSLERKSAVESIELQDRSFSSRERSSSTGSSYPECDVRRRVRSSSGSCESSTAEPDRVHLRQGSPGTKTEGSFVLVGRTRSKTKESVLFGVLASRVGARVSFKDHAPSATVSSHNSRFAAIKESDTSGPAVVRRGSRSKPRDVDGPNIRTSVRLSSKEKVSAVSNVRFGTARESVQATSNVRESSENVNREKLASDLDIRGSEKRARSRGQSRSQSSSSRTNSDEHHDSSGSKKSCETVRLNSQSPESKFTFKGEHVVARKSKKDSTNKDPVTSPSNKVNIVPSTKQTRGSVTIDTHLEISRNTETLRDSQTRQNSNQVRRKPTPEEPTKEKLQRVESRVPYERQNNDLPADRQDGVRDKLSRQPIPEPSQKVYVITNPAEETKQIIGQSSIEEVHHNEHDSCDAQKRDVDLNTPKSYQEPVRIKDQFLFSDFRPENLKETFSRLSSKIGERFFNSEKAQYSGLAFDSSVSKSIDDKLTQQVSDQKSLRDDKYSVYDAECVKSDVYEDSSNMDYDLFFHQASRGVNGTGSGGGGYRGYPAVLDGGYSSPSLRREARGQFGLYQNNISGPFVHTVGIRPGLDRARIFHPVVGQDDLALNPVVGQDDLALNPRSVPYTKFQVPTTPLGPIPTVQLIASPDMPGYNIDTIHKEWERRGSNGSTRSHNSNKSNAGPKFLGVTTESTWMKWSRDRRASYRRRLEKMERSEALDSDVVRVSTPVKKARQEGLKFVHPDLEARYLSEDDLNELRRHKQQQVHVMRVIEKSRKNKFNMKTEMKLSVDQWHALQEFWENQLFIRARYLGLMISILALICMIVSIASNDWLTHDNFSEPYTF